MESTKNRRAFFNFINSSETTYFFLTRYLSIVKQSNGWPSLNFAIDDDDETECFGLEHCTFFQFSQHTKRTLLWKTNVYFGWIGRAKKNMNDTRKTFHKIIWPCVLLWIVIDTERRRIFFFLFFLYLSVCLPHIRFFLTQYQFQLMCFFCAFWMNILYARITWINVCQCSFVFSRILRERFWNSLKIGCVDTYTYSSHKARRLKCTPKWRSEKKKINK